jgi:hypothetical protein
MVSSSSSNRKVTSQRFHGSHIQIVHLGITDLSFLPNIWRSSQFARRFVFATKYQIVYALTVLAKMPCRLTNFQVYIVASSVTDYVQSQHFITLCMCLIV